MDDNDNGNEQVIRVVILYFLRSLMKIERERRGLSRRKLSAQVGWPETTWADIERAALPMSAGYWTMAASILGVSISDMVRRLNAFVNKHPMLWFERSRDGDISVCERPVTSPRALRSGKTFNVDLNSARPSLYYELASYVSDPDALIAKADELGFFEAVEPVKTSVPARPRLCVEPKERKRILERRISSALEGLSIEKLALLERVIDKFERFDEKALATAYRHFSLSVSQK